MCIRDSRLAYADDSSYYLLCALEVIDEDGKLERKADMFTKRTIKPHQAVAVVDTASEALAVSISEKACVDMGYMSPVSYTHLDVYKRQAQGRTQKDSAQKECGKGDLIWETLLLRK